MVYIDTSGSFSASRLFEVVRPAFAAAVDGDDDVMADYADYATIECMGRVRVMRAHDLPALVDLLTGLESEWAETAPPTLLILDSISSVASTVLGGSDTISSHAMLSAVGLTLCRLGRVWSVCVLVTNSTVSDRIAGGSGCMPALGMTWLPVPSTRLWMERDGALTLMRSPHTPLATKSSPALATSDDGR